MPEENPQSNRTGATKRPCVGRIASGRGRVVEADDSSFSVSANPPLTAPEQVLAVKYGFDDESPEQDASLFIGDKATVRSANGDVNHLARVVTSRQGRGR